MHRRTDAKHFIWSNRAVDGQKPTDEGMVCCRPSSEDDWLALEKEVLLFVASNYQLGASGGV
jgi:hypothetical protein